VAKFRKMPVVIDAVQFLDTGDAIAALSDFMGLDLKISYAEPESPTLTVQTLEGPLTARVGDWIIRGVKGEFYPCKPDIFARTYEVLSPCGRSLSAAP